MTDNGDNASFLGKGWGFPPAFEQNGRNVQCVSEDEDIRQSLEILLGTAQGERIMREDFGCDLQRFVFEEISQGLLNDIARIVGDAVIYHEPRVVLNSVDVDADRQDAGELAIVIDYTVRSTNSRFNLVYPYYLNEATYANV